MTQNKARTKAEAVRGFIELENCLVVIEAVTLSFHQTWGPNYGEASPEAKALLAKASLALTEAWCGITKAKAALVRLERIGQ